MTGGLQPAWPHLLPLPVPESAAGGVLKFPGVLDPAYRIVLSLKIKLVFPSTITTLTCTVTAVACHDDEIFTRSPGS